MGHFWIENLCKNHNISETGKYIYLISKTASYKHFRVGLSANSCKGKYFNYTELLLSFDILLWIFLHLILYGTPISDIHWSLKLVLNRVGNDVKKKNWMTLKDPLDGIYSKYWGISQNDRKLNAKTTKRTKVIWNTQKWFVWSEFQKPLHSNLWFLGFD